MGKIGEKFLAGTQYIDILVIGFKEIGTPSIPILNIFEKLDFPFFYLLLTYENSATYEHF